MTEHEDGYEAAPRIVACEPDGGVHASEPSASGKRLTVAEILTWLGVFVVAILTLVVAWRLVVLPADAVQIQFAFTDFLALILALFAVGLSAAFYFRSTSESSKFFENVYEFTKDVSVVLGKIEAGFGERLKHLDEGYASIRDSVDALPSAIRAREKELDTAEDALVKLQKERDDIARSMLTARAADKSKIQELTQELEAKDGEIATLRHEVVERSRNLRRTLHQPEELEPREESLRRLESYLMRKVVMQVGPSALREMKHREVAAAFDSCRSGVAPAARRDMLASGLIDSDEQLTRAGAQLLKRLAFENFAPDPRPESPS